MKRRWLRTLLFLAALAWAGLAAFSTRAEHFDIDLSVDGLGDHQEAHRDDYPPFEGHNRRPVYYGKKGEMIRFQFLFTNTNPHEVLKRVGIRYYLTPVAAPGAKYQTPVETNMVVSGSFELDFKFKAKIGVRQNFRITEAGSYLLRVESSNSASDHEHFAAIDLVIR